jgi:hypothetical protein
MLRDDAPICVIMVARAEALSVLHRHRPVLCDHASLEHGAARRLDDERVRLLAGAENERAGPRAGERSDALDRRSRRGPPRTSRRASRAVGASVLMHLDRHLPFVVQVSPFAPAGRRPCPLRQRRP